MLGQLGFGFGANAVDLAAGQGPDHGFQIVGLHDGNAIGFVELARHLGQQLVGRNAHRAGEAGVVKDGFLNEPCQHAPTLALPARHMGEVDVDLVYATVLHERCDVSDDGFKTLRVMAVLVKIHRQQDGVWAQLGRLHHPHGRAHAKLPRGIGGGGDDTAPCVACDARKEVERDFVQLVFRPFVVGVRLTQAGQHVVNTAATSANHHRQALELWVAQQLDGGVKRIHVEVGDAALKRGLRRRGHSSPIHRDQA